MEKKKEVGQNLKLHIEDQVAIKIRILLTSQVFQDADMQILKKAIRCLLMKIIDRIAQLKGETDVHNSAYCRL